MSASDLDLLNEEVPLCFDTSAIYGQRGARRLLQTLRDRFPSRRLIVPALVVSERVRQLKEEFDRSERKFDVEMVKGFLQDPRLRLEITAYDHEIALGAWVDLAAGLPDQVWKPYFEIKKTLDRRPCGERCRAGDHLIQATARQHQAILVTNDDVLYQHAARLQPGVVREVELRRRLQLAAIDEASRYLR